MILFESNLFSGESGYWIRNIKFSAITELTASEGGIDHQASLQLWDGYS
jgi:hypothetical protein